MGSKANFVFNKERTGAFYAVDFVGADAHEVDAELFDIQRNFSKRLNRVNMNERRRIFCPDYTRERFNRFNRAKLVVDRHHADKDGVFINGIFNFLNRNNTVAVNREADNGEAFLLKRFKSP